MSSPYSINIGTFVLTGSTQATGVALTARTCLITNTGTAQHGSLLHAPENGTIQTIVNKGAVAGILDATPTDVIHAGTVIAANGSTSYIYNSGTWYETAVV